MFSVQRHEEKSKAVSAVLPTKQNLTTTTIVLSRNKNYYIETLNPIKQNSVS